MCNVVESEKIELDNYTMWNSKLLRMWKWYPQLSGSYSRNQRNSNAINSIIESNKSDHFKCHWLESLTELFPFFLILKYSCSLSHLPLEYGILHMKTTISHVRCITLHRLISESRSICRKVYTINLNPPPTKLWIAHVEPANTIAEWKGRNYHQHIN